MTGLPGPFLCGKGSGEMKSSRSSFYGDVEVWPVSWWEKRGRTFPCGRQTGAERTQASALLLGELLLSSMSALSPPGRSRNKQPKAASCSCTFCAAFGLLPTSILSVPDQHLQAQQLIYLSSEKSQQKLSNTLLPRA